jgi:hypothetical protein
MAKKITNRSILGQRGINLVEEYVLAMGFAWHPTNQSVEAGIDGHIEIRNLDTEQALNLVVAVQSKACTTFPSESETTVTYYCKDDDIAYWLSGNLPVVLVVSCPDKKEAFWINVTQYFHNQDNRSSKKVVFDKAHDRFTRDVRSRLFELARPRDSGLYLSPLPKPEELLPNLLPVSFKYNSVFQAQSRFTDPKNVVDTFRTAALWPQRDWAMKGGVILSFQDLSDPIWDAVCIPGSVCSVPLSQYAGLTHRDERNHFVQLLNRCLEVKLRRDGIFFHRNREFYFFASTEGLRKRTVSFRSVAQQSERTVFEAYRHKESGDVRFCRHAAFHGYFREFEGVWMLEVTPTYYFTRDGVNQDKFEADRLKGIKRLDRHRAVLGQLLAWIDFLTRPSKTLFEEAYPHFAFMRPDKCETGVGIDDKSWLEREDPEELVRIQAEEAPTGLLFI